MISLIVGTDRPESNSLKVANNYLNTIKGMKQEVQLFSLSELPSDFFHAGRYGEPPESFAQILHKFIHQAERFVFVVPEYNGSFPGVLKHFMDIVHPSTWAGKRAALAGVATGRAGNLRGIDHFMAVLHYLKVDVYHQKPLFSSIHTHLDEQFNIANREYQMLIEQQVQGFLQY